MKLKLKIRQKILLFVLTASIVLYVISIGYIIIRSRTSAYDQAIELTNMHAKKAAQDVRIVLERDMSVVRTLAESFTFVEHMQEKEWKTLMQKMYKPVYMSNPHFYAIWDSWEFKYVVPGWKKDHGRYAYSIWKEKGIITEKQETRSLEGDPNLYGAFKQGKKETVWEPYLDESTAVTEKNLMASLCVPTLIDGNYWGMVGVDIILTQFQKIVQDIKPFEGSYAFMVSNTGIIAGHPDGNLINKNISELFPEEDETYKIKEYIKKGEEPLTFISRDKNGNGHYYVYEPIRIGRTDTPWSLCISVPLKEINAKADENFNISLIIGIIVLLILTIILSLIAQNIAQPIVRLTKTLKRLSNGEIDKKLIQNINSGDEIEEMANALNTAIEGLNDKNYFANQIGTGNLEIDLELLSEYDELGKSLKEMQYSLKTAREEEAKLKEEEEKRRWTNEGLAKFGDILRQNYSEITELSYNIIKSLVHYLKANQGGIFIKDDTLEDHEKPVYILNSAFAFDRRKYLEKQIEEGDGLVGTCAIEKETIYLTEIPQEYIEITSGLGGANPSALLIVPLKLENEVYGVIEIASFNKFKPHEIEFVEKIGESIASTISSVKVNTRTALLLERSQQQAEEMAAQEEEMRQNLEELQATQEEMARKRAESDALAEAMDSSVGVVEIDFNKKILTANELFLDYAGLQEEDLFGKFHFDFIPDDRLNDPEYTKLWELLKSGQKFSGIGKYNFNNQERLFRETFVPYRDENDALVKVLLIVIDMDAK